MKRIQLDDEYCETVDSTEYEPIKFEEAFSPAMACFISAAIYLYSIFSDEFWNFNWEFVGGSLIQLSFSLFKVRAKSDCMPMWHNAIEIMRKFGQQISKKTVEQCQYYVAELNGKSINQAVNTLCGSTLLNQIFPSQFCSIFWKLEVFSLLYAVVLGISSLVFFGSGVYVFMFWGQVLQAHDVKLVLGIQLFSILMVIVYTIVYTITFSSMNMSSPLIFDSRGAAQHSSYSIGFLFVGTAFLFAICTCGYITMKLLHLSVDNPKKKAIRQQQEEYDNIVQSTKPQLGVDTDFFDLKPLKQTPTYSYPQVQYNEYLANQYGNPYGAEPYSRYV